MCQVNGPNGLLSARNASVSTQNKLLAQLAVRDTDRDTVMRLDTRRDMETRDRAKTKHTSIDTEQRPIH